MSFPDRLNLIVTLDGVDITDYVVPGLLSINNLLTHQVDTCTLTLEDAGVLSPADWQELVITAGSRIFAGFVTSIREVEGPDLGINYELSASDYAIYLDKVIVKEEFVNKNDAEILDLLFTEYLAGMGFNAVAYVTAIKTHPRKRFNRSTLLECVQDLAKLAKADWYIDYNKNLHFFDREIGSTAAPFSLSDDPDKSASIPYYDMKINKDGSGIVNRVEILGGNYRSDDTEFKLPGNGEDPRIILPFRLHAPDGESSIKVYRNDGTEASPIWTPMTVRVGYIDELAGPNEVLYYYQEKVIEQQANWPALPNAVKIEAKYEVPLRTRVRDDASIAHYGLVFDDVIIDDTITDKALARVAGLAKLAEAAMAKTAISLSCDQPGLRAGMIVHLVNATHGIDGNYLVQKVAVKVGIYGRAKFNISLGTYNPDLIDMLLILARNAKPKAIWREDEVLDELLQVAESVSFSEDYDVITSQSPYFFDSAVPNGFYWGFGAFSAKFYSALFEFSTDYPAGSIPVQYSEGNGTLEVSDSASKFSITGGALVQASRTLTLNPMVYRLAAIGVAGRALYWKIKVSGNIAGWAGARATLSNPGHRFSMATLTTTDFLAEANITISTGDVVSAGIYYEVILVGTSPVLYLIRGGIEFPSWTLLWVSHNPLSGSVYQMTTASGTNGSWYLDKMGDFQLYGDFLQSYGIATYYNSAPLNGLLLSSDVNFLLDFSWTPKSGEILEIAFRRTNANNCWIVRCSQSAGTMKMIQRQDGIETERSSATPTFPVGTIVKIKIRAVESSIRAWTNTWLRNQYETATFNQTATEVVVTGFATGSDLIIYPRIPGTTIQQEINEHIP